MPHLIVDAHQDLAWVSLTFGRDYTQPIEETRRREKASPYILASNGDATANWHEYQRGRVALVFSVLFAAPLRAKAGKWDTQVYATFEQANQIYKRQLDFYDRLFDQHPEKFTPIHTAPQLASLIETWNHPESVHPSGRPTGLLTLMEGAEGIRSIDELTEWWERGVRIIGPAWAATRFCGGTNEPGPFTSEGRQLLGAMAEHGFLLDLTHLAWEAALEALDRYEGHVMASHSNPLKMVKNGTRNRFLTDEIVDGIIERDGVIGIAPYNRFLVESWKNSDPREDCPLDMVAAHIDYICQRAGDARHVGLGTDLDGGFGLQHIPPS